jgi:hypothetical protein
MEILNMDEVQHPENIQPNIELVITDEIENQYISNDTSNILDRELFNDDLLKQFYDLNDKLSNNLINNLFKTEKTDLIGKRLFLSEYIQTKINKLVQNLRLIEYKNSKYKFCYNTVNISIIIMSTLLTLIEAIKGIVMKDLIDEDHFLSYIFRMSPIILSSTITCSASILKFKKYQEKMENICKILENASTSIINLKKLREELIFIKTDSDYDKLYMKFINELYEPYISIIQTIDRCLKKEDYDLYLRNLYLTDYKLFSLQKEKEFFLNNYNENHSMDDILINIKKYKKIHNCCL